MARTRTLNGCNLDFRSINKQTISCDGEFDELNHEIYEFINQCLNFSDNELLIFGFNVEKLDIKATRDLGNTLIQSESENYESNLVYNKDNKNILDYNILNDTNNQSYLYSKTSNIEIKTDKIFDWNNHMLRAAFLGNIELLEFCIIQGANTLFIDKVGRTALHYAAACGWLPIVKVLLKYKCDINMRDQKFWTPLHIAVSKKFSETVNILLEAGADINLLLPHTCAPCRGGPISSKAIHFAAIKGNSTITETLIKYGSSINDQDEDGKTPLHYASFRKNLLYVKWLISNGADVRIVDKSGRAPLHIAAIAGHVDIAEELINAGSSVDLLDCWDMTALSLAEVRGHTEMVNFLSPITSKNIQSKCLNLDTLESIVLKTIITGLQEPKTGFLTRAVKLLGPQICLQIFEQTMKIENNGGLWTVDGSRKKTMGGIFCFLLKNMACNNQISKKDWDYIRQEEKERINARNIRKRNSRKLQNI
ncbi:hypothetical protein ACR3K2_38590 [Cryptosporidium serpentis]